MMAWSSGYLRMLSLLTFLLVMPWMASAVPMRAYTHSGVATEEELRSLFQVPSSSGLKSSTQYTRKLAGGDFTNINSILAPLVLDIELVIDPIAVATSVEIAGIGLFVDLTATIDREGICYDIQIKPGGDVYITSALGDRQDINGTSYRPFTLNIFIDVLQFECDIGLNVVLNEIVATGDLLGEDLINSNTGNGRLQFRTENATLSQDVDFFSESVSTGDPAFYQIGECIADPVFLNYTGQEIGQVLIVGDITDIVIEELENDPDLIFTRVAVTLCDLAADLSDVLGELLVDNEVVKGPSDFFTDNPFVPSPTGLISALNMENAIKGLGLSGRDSLQDLNDKDNLFVGILLPEDPNPEDTPIVNSILEALTDEEETAGVDGGYDPLLLFVNDLLELNFIEDGGKFVDVDVLNILEDGLFTDEPEEVDLSFDIDLEFEGITVQGSISIERLLFQMDPPPYRNGSNPVLSHLGTLGNYTVHIPRVLLRHIGLNTTLAIDLTIDNPGSGIEGDFLETPFNAVFNELLDIDLYWERFSAELSLLAPITIQDFDELHIGMVLEYVLECILSIFQTTPRLTGFTVAYNSIGLEIRGGRDAAFVLIQDLVNEIITIYQPVIPRVVQWAVNENLVDEEIFAPEVCPTADLLKDDQDEFPYDFSKGFIADIGEALDVDTVNDALEFVEIDSGELVIVEGGSDGALFDGNISLNITLPVFEGWQQFLYFELTKVWIEGLLPPALNELQLLFADPTKEFYPQELHNYASMGTPEKPLVFRTIFSLFTSEPFKVEDVDTDYPVTMFPQRNIVDFSMSFEEITLLIDLFVSYSEYGLNSTMPEDVLDLYCWLGKLQKPFFVREIDLTLLRPRIVVDCDCNNRFFELLKNQLELPSTWPEVLAFLTDLVDRGETWVEDLFGLEEWPRISAESKLLCAGGTLESEEYHIHEYHEDFLPLVQFLGFLAIAVFVPSLVSRYFAKYGPQIGLKKKAILEEEHAVSSGDHFTRSLAFNPLVPLPLRILMPLFLVANVILFLIGDTGDAVRIDIIAQVLGVPIEFNNFISLSVISTVQALFRSGGIVLALFLALLSIAWPYVKLFLLFLTWFTPPSKLSVHRRGVIIEWLDILGRFSFAEFHFLVFVLVIMRIRGGSPKLDWLPEEDLFSLELNIIPLISLFTFSCAVFLSIILSNVFLFYQVNIEKESRIRLRDERLKAFEQTKQVVGLTSHAIDEDRFSFRMAVWDFTVYEPQPGNEKKTFNYSFSVTRMAVFGISFIVTVALLLLVLAVTIKSLSVRFIGLFGYIIAFSGQDTDYALSVVELLISIYEAYENNFIIYFVGAVFILTIAIVPILQTGLLFSMLFQSFNVKQARRILQLHHISSVWCCLDVFVIAISLTVLEIPTVASALVSGIDVCEDIGALMRDVLLPLDFVNEDDVDAACLRLISEVSAGAYLAIIAVFMLAIANFVVATMFQAYVRDRERVVVITEQINRDEEDGVFEGNDDVKPWHEMLQRFGLIKVENLVSRVERRQKDAIDAKIAGQAVVASNPIYLDDATPATTHMRLGNRQLAKKRAQEERRLQKIDAQRAYEYSMPAQERVSRQLEVFLQKVDPKIVHLVPKLVDEAFARPDGLMRLNEKLMDKYGSTIMLDL